MSETDFELSPPNRRGLAGSGEILRALVQKELKVKYKRSALGFFWSLITPVALTGIYLFVFIYVYHVPQKDFILFLLSGLLPWNYFNMSVLAATTSLVDNGPLIRKVYFQRLLLPLSSVFANLINFLMGLLILMAIVAISGKPLWTQLHWLFIAVIMETVLLTGISLILSVGNVYFRDIQQIISILMLVIFFATPVVYPLEKVPARFRPFIEANPMTAVVEVYRAALFKIGMPDLRVVAVGLVEILFICLLGIVVFRRTSSQLAKEV